MRPYATLSYQLEVDGEADSYGTVLVVEHNGRYLLFVNGEPVARTELLPVIAYVEQIIDRLRGVAVDSNHSFEHDFKELETLITQTDRIDERVESCAERVDRDDAGDLKRRDLVRRYFTGGDQ